MSIEIPPDLQAFVAQELKTGRYRTEQEVVSAALRILQRERDEAVAGILAGLDDVAAGRVQPLVEAFADLRRELSEPDAK